jgi:hypothetical protein
MGTKSAAKTAAAGITKAKESSCPEEEEVAFVNH